MLWGCKNLIHGFSTFSINDSSKKVSFRFTAPSDVTINSFTVYISNVTGSPPKLNFRLQSDATGLPSGTFLVSSSVDAGTGFRSTGSFSYTLTGGTVYHCVITGASGHNGSNYHSIRTLIRVPTTGEE